MTFEQRLEGAMVQWTSGEEYSGQRDDHGQRSCSGGVPGGLITAHSVAVAEQEEWRNQVTGVLAVADCLGY